MQDVLVLMLPFLRRRAESYTDMGILARASILGGASLGEARIGRAGQALEIKIS